ncbi:MAG: DNA mismatch repair endonuclease MutL [Armatimonadetes bacterium]|nr:DNA mismatch repair endonuclease MutL [Armatimonadota bacterium]
MEAAQRRVRLLDPHTVNQIAAGEVVERPASAVKELVENAIDAGARRIEVELVESGRKRLRVRDDGTGIQPDDLPIALQRHATSKITRIEDLFVASSLGFRGEALPSIASVSRMQIRSATTDGVAACITVEGGEVEPISYESMPQGTEVVVEDLFFNTPARLKFLKSDQTELNACLEIVQRLAVAFPELAFTFRHNNSELLRTTGDGDVLGAIAAVWGREVAKALGEIDHYEGNVRVRGFVSGPHFTKPNRNYQWVFVNRRPVRNRGLQTAIDIAYRMLTPERRFPVVALLLDVEPSRVDSNVSPTKMDVKFQQEASVADAVRHGIKQGLLRMGMLPDASDLIGANQALEQTRSVMGSGWIFPSGTSGTPTEALIQAQRPLFAPGSISVAPMAENPFAVRAYEALLDGLRVVGQIMNTFIIAENHQGMLIIDQHVAHERILYEKLRAGRGVVPVEKQSLLMPESLHLTAYQAGLLQENLEPLAALGFDIEPFGDGTFLLRAAPAALRRKSPSEVVVDILEELEHGGNGCVSPTRDGIWITCACKMAVKAGDPLSLAEMEKLIVDLCETENPYLCPHGRPITLVMARGDLERKFKR